MTTRDGKTTDITVFFPTGSSVAQASWKLPKLKVTNSLNDSIPGAQVQVDDISIMMKEVLQSTFWEMLCSHDAGRFHTFEITYANWKAN